MWHLTAAVALILSLANSSDVFAEKIVCISNSTTNCSFRSGGIPPNLYDEYFSHSHSDTEVAISVCAPRAVGPVKVLANETGGGDRKMLLEVRCINEPSEFNVCNAQHEHDCPDTWRFWHGFRFISCSIGPRTEDQMADTMCTITDAAGKKIIRPHLKPVKKMSDVPDQFCGIAMFKVACLND